MKKLNYTYLSSLLSKSTIAFLGQLVESVMTSK